MKLKESLKIHEGFREYIYKCSEGHDTIGYGFKCSDLSSDELALNGGKVAPMCEEVANRILDLKIAKLKEQVFRAVPWVESKPEAVQDVICEMAYQMGLWGMLGFKNTLKLIQDSEYKKASENMLKSKWAKQTPNRARALANIIAKV